MSNPTLSQNSVITSIFTGNTLAAVPFLTCGGTNFANKSGTTWANFTVGTTNFKYIFNSQFNGKTGPLVTGYSASGNVPTTINQSLYDGNQIQYICGQFTSLSSGGAQNITYFNPIISRTTTVTFNTLNSISFTGADNAVYSMAFLNTTAGTVNTNRIVIAGTFTKATISGTDSTANIALLDLGSGVYSINTTGIVANGVINASTTIINSIIVIGNIIYVAGAASTNCLFYSYNTTSNVWADLLGGSYAGNINVIQAIGRTQIAVGGSFTTIGAATSCNNIAIYTIGGAFRSLGNGATKGVTGVPASSPIYATPRVFALANIGDLLWVGGYFVNAGDSVFNSIAIYNILGSTTYKTLANTWSTVKRAGSAVIGLLKDTGGTDPGVVYALNISAIDTGIINVGGSFRITTSIVTPNTSETIYNLVKITTPTINTSSTDRTYSKFNSTSVSTTKS